MSKNIEIEVVDFEGNHIVYKLRWNNITDTLQVVISDSSFEEGYAAAVEAMNQKLEEL